MVRNKLYYDFMQQFMSAGLLNKNEVAGKKCLIVSRANLATEVSTERDLMSSLKAAGASACKLYGHYNSLEENASGTIAEMSIKLKDEFDVVMVLDGLEKEKDILSAVCSIKGACKPRGLLFVFSRTPDFNGNMYGTTYYEDYWRMDEGILKNLFQDFVLRQTVCTSNGILAGAKFFKPSNEVKFDISSVRIYQNALKKMVSVGDAKYNYGYFAKYKLLGELGDRCGTDKGACEHNYLEKYEFFLQNFRHSSFRLLELGVFGGASLRMWREYFPFAEITGVDIREEFKIFSSDRINIIIADLAKEDELNKLHDIHPQLIIDDASHIWSHQIKALFNLWGCLPHGGVYIIEDMETSVNKDIFPGYNDFPIDTYEVCSRIAKVSAGKEPCDDSICHENINAIGMETELISIMHGSCILIKR